MGWPKRDFWLFALLGAALTIGASTLSASGATKSSNKAPVIKIVARRFSYSPDEIVLKKGVPVVLEISSVDFLHGFKVPDLGLRVDLPPGRKTLVPLKPQKVGVYDFLCDNFCGSGHETMTGRIVVKD